MADATNDRDVPLVDAFVHVPGIDVHFYLYLHLHGRSSAGSNYILQRGILSRPVVVAAYRVMVCELVPLGRSFIISCGWNTAIGGQVE